nr:MAG TPA: hypothetical protein [Caudoviricetes sp.]
MSSKIIEKFRGIIYISVFCDFFRTLWLHYTRFIQNVNRIFAIFSER